MKKLILFILLITINIPVLVFAKNPKETVEYWENNQSDAKFYEAEVEMEKCWNPLQTHFIVPVGSTQWNICCAIRAAYDSDWDGRKWSFDEVNNDMIKSKKQYGDKY